MDVNQKPVTSFGFAYACDIYLNIRGKDISYTDERLVQDGIHPDYISLLKERGRWYVL